MSQTIPGPDGFLLDSNDPLYASQMLLSDFLAEDEQRDPNRTVLNGAKWKKLPKREVVRHVEAILRRLAWLIDNDRELETGHVSRLRLIHLLRVFHSMKLPRNADQLSVLFDLTSPLLTHIAPEGPVECTLEFLKTGELTAELSGSIRRFHSAMDAEQPGPSASMLTIRQSLHVLTWLDEWEPLDPARCWSECIRRDFRAMTGERRAKWRRLLTHIRGNAPVRMPASWAREAEDRLATVGLEDFRDQMAIWFAPFRSEQPLPLSVAGSHILKGLVWYSALTNDATVKEIALWLLEVKWKNKRNVDKSMVALESLGISREELRARSLLKPDPAIKPVSEIFNKILSSRLVSGTTSHIAVDPDEDLIVVQGQLHFYRIFRQSGRIERATDNAVLELDWSAIPDQMRFHFNRESSSPEEIFRRAHLLTLDSIYGRYFAAKSGK